MEPALRAGIGGGPCAGRRWRDRRIRYGTGHMMERMLEPELMDDPEQALVYSKADFEEENQGFVDRFQEYYPDLAQGHVVDLGCGPGDIAIRLARTSPNLRITGVDASGPMIELAEKAVAATGLVDGIQFRRERFQTCVVGPAEGIVSNDLSQHLPQRA